MADGDNGDTLSTGIVGRVLEGTTEFIKKIVPDPTGYRDISKSAGQSNYDFNYLVFPEDLQSNPQLGNWMMININIPVKGALSAAAGKLLETAGLLRGLTITGSNVGDIRSAFDTASMIRTSTGGGVSYSRVDQLKFGLNGGNRFGGGSSSTALNRPSYSIPRATRRIASSICIFMPNGGLTYLHQNQYAEIELTPFAGKAILGGVSMLAGLAAGGLGGIRKGYGLGAALGNVGARAGQALLTASKIAGMPINPRVEVLYSHTDLRSFTFEFLMSPKNKSESVAMWNIIKTLRQHSVPELDPATGGSTFIPPAEFDFTFYHKGKENTNIPRINTSVLNAVEVQYDPTGTFGTFSNGHPVAVRLSLRFTEVEPLHRKRIQDQGL